MCVRARVCVCARMYAYARVCVRVCACCKYIISYNPIDMISQVDHGPLILYGLICHINRAMLMGRLFS